MEKTEQLTKLRQRKPVLAAEKPRIRSGKPLLKTGKLPAAASPGNQECRPKFRLHRPENRFPRLVNRRRTEELETVREPAGKPALGRGIPAQTGETPAAQWRSLPELWSSGGRAETTMIGVCVASVGAGKG